MKITVASHSGFCMGVRMAMNTILRDVQDSAGPIETLGPLIHNPQALELLRKKNVAAISDPAKVTAPTVVIRTHGVPPQTEEALRSRARRVLDATCPHVRRIHRIIGEHYGRGASILIYGDTGHAEVVGLMGHARDRGFLLSSPADVAGLPGLSQVCLVSQTTQSLAGYQDVKKAVLARFPSARVFDTICRATDNRQQEAEQLARESDALIVVGGKNSANSTRLYEIGKAHCPKTFHIETEAELSAADFAGVRRVAIVSGASTPSWLLNRVFERLKEISNAQRPWFLRIPLRVAQIFVSFNGYLALGAVLMAWAAGLLVGHAVNWLHLAAAGLYIHSMYLLNHLTNIRANQYEEVFLADPVFLHRWLSAGMLLVTGGLGLAAAVFMGRTEAEIMLVLMAAGVLYHINILPKNNLPFLHNRKLKDITLSKDLGISLAWAVVCTALPWRAGSGFDHMLETGNLYAFAFIFVVVFTRTLFHDLHDIQRDQIVGRETLPIVMGSAFGKLFPALPLLALTLIPALAFGFEAWQANALLLLACPVYILVVHRLFRAGRLADAILFDGVVDFMFILPAVLLFLGSALIR